MKLITNTITLLLGFCLFASPTQAENRPNVILVMSDDQGYGDLACHGNPWLQTPNLDRLHAESVRFTNFHVDTICSPTRAALMTGQVAGRVGVSGTLGGLEIPTAGEIMMPEVFAASGYRTAMFGKWHLGDHYPFRPGDRGFDHVLWHRGGGIWQASDHWNNDYFNDTYLLNGEPVKYEGYCTDVWFGEAMKYIEEHRDEPFFCYIPTNAPHGPYLVDETYYDLYKDNPEVLKPEFYGMITNLDENMGRLMQHLRELGLEENTILIFMTDNGTAGVAVETNEQDFVTKGYNAGMRGSKARDYEGGHRVPFFIRWPKGGITGGRDVDELTAHIDVMQTLIDLCGLERPAENSFDGISLAPLLREEAMKTPVRTLFGRSNPNRWRGVTMMDRWRLVKGEELYDVQADPGQKQDIADQNPEMAKLLRDSYDAYYAEASAALKTPKRYVVGSDQENPMHLSSMSWDTTTAVWSQTHVRRGLEKTGYWLIDADRPGTYEISLRRWPVEADLPIAAGCPKHPMEEENCWSGAWPEGVALPIRSAQLKIGDFDQTKPVSDDAVAVTFEVDLEKGPNRIDALFLDENEDALCSAYYASVERKAGETAQSSSGWPGVESTWKRYSRFDFQVDGRDCFVVVPNQTAAGKPWVWRARFPTYHSEVDALLLEQGFHVAYINTDGMLGSPRALDRWDRFYETMTGQYGLAKNVALYAVSRGGLFAYRWAARNPNAVACIYGDVPVCDIKSWPLGQGAGIGHEKTWQTLLAEYSFTEEQALAFNENPIDVLEPIAEAGIPLLHIVSLNDMVVPPQENTFVLAEGYRALGGNIEIIEVEEGTRNGHHFRHPDPARAADFIQRAAGPPGSSISADENATDHTNRAKKRKQFTRSTSTKK